MTSTGSVNNNGGYDQFIEELHSRGVKTTKLGKNETNFLEYGKALDDSLEQELLQSFDTEADYEIQEKLAGLFTNRNVINSGSFISACKQLGLTCEVKYQKTTYVSDYKAGNFSHSARQGHIAIYTISDGKGGQIKIADANGNGSLESEELFLNEIIGGINQDIEFNINTINVPNAVSAQGGASNEFGNAQQQEQAKPEVTQEEFNEKVEQYLESGFTKAESTRLANTVLGTDHQTYTGEYKDVSQKDFDKAVESYMKEGYSEELSVIKAKKELGVKGMEYEGDGIKEDEIEEPEESKEK